MKRALLAAMILLAAASPGLAASTSVFTTRPDDPQAAYAKDFGARGDGNADDSAAIQAAL